MKLPKALVITIAASLSLLSSSSGEVLFEETFEGGNGRLAKRLIGKKQVTFAPGKGPDGSDAIKVAYIGTGKGSDRIVMGEDLSKAVQAATLSFDVMFDEDFQWVKGGKLHGLGPKKPVTGGAPRRPDGWSARMMFKEDGRLTYYVYDQDGRKKPGHAENRPRKAFKAGKWHNVVCKVIVNDAGEKNGKVEVFVDGRSISRMTKIELRGENSPETLITHFIFATFHGGGSPDWAPKDSSGKYTTVYAYYDNFKVVEGAD